MRSEQNYWRQGAVYCLLLMLILVIVPAWASAAAKAPKAIEISGSSWVAKGKTITLKATVSPGKAAQDVIWSSGNRKIATVTEKGVVKGARAGTVEITATSRANKKIKQTFTVTVTEKAVKSISITGAKEMNLTDLKEISLTAKAKPEKAAQAFTWKSSNTKVATVNGDGVVTARKAGVTKITATAIDGSRKKKTVEIRVTEETANEETIETSDVEEKVQWIISHTIKKGMSEKEKAKALHDWIINNAHYDITLQEGEADGVLIKGYGVCDSYTKAYGLLLDKAGIVNCRISGWADGPHSWNMVRIDGKWYHVDTTWDDPVTGNEKKNDQIKVKSGMENSFFFMVSDQFMKENSHFFNQYGEGEFVFALDQDNQGIIILGIPERGIRKATIPETIKHDGKSYPVTGIDFEQFIGRENIEELYLPKGIKDVYFSGWSRLKEFNWPKGISSIRDRAFENCSSLETIAIPEGVKSIGANAFSGCTALKEVTIPKGVTDIGDGAFSGCTAMEKINIPEGVTRIGDVVFSKCEKLKEMTLPAGVVSIGDGAFSGCSGLSSITLPEGITQIEGMAMANCTSLRTLRLPESLVSLGEMALWGCRITEIHLPGKVIGALEEAFALDSIDCLKTIRVLNGTEIEDYGFYRYENAEEILLPDSITKIGNFAFSDCRSLKEITIPKNVKSIGESAFNSCTEMTKVTIPDGVNEIGEGAFENCASLKEVWLPAGLESLAYGAFDSCPVETLHLPQQMISSFKDAFDLQGLKMIDVMNGTVLPKDAFYGCENLENVILPESMEELGDYAFCGCKELKEITIPAGVKKIGFGVFMNCSGLETIPEMPGVTVIAEQAFYGCAGLRSVRLGEGIREIREDAFRNCANLQKVELPEGLEILGPGAFYECGVTEVTIPGTVREMLENAFHVEQLQKVEILNGTETPGGELSDE